MLLRHKAGLMDMARNLCSPQKPLFCLRQLVRGDGVHDIPFKLR